jgi:hypothetical protein
MKKMGVGGLVGRVSGDALNCYICSRTSWVMSILVFWWPLICKFHERSANHGHTHRRHYHNPAPPPIDELRNKQVACIGTSEAAAERASQALFAASARGSCVAR